MTPELSVVPDMADVHDELRQVARELLAKPGPAAAPDWTQIAESGWLGLEAPAALDGAEATFAEVAIILQEMGRAATPSPYLGTAVLAAGALTLLQPAPDRDRLLRETATGTATPALALPGEPGAIPFRLAEGRVQGRATFVPDASTATRLLLPAVDPDGTPVIVDVPPQTPGLTVHEQPVLDATRTLGQVRADNVEVGSVWRFTGDPGAAILRLQDRAAVAIACDSLGLSEAMLDATVAYAGVREQFGRPIGSFQAVKHACADMLVQITVGRHLVAAAIGALATRAGDASATASMAKSYTCDAAVEITGKAMQLHGGMGYTWETGIHAYLKRATLNRALFGSPANHRERLAARYT